MRLFVLTSCVLLLIATAFADPDYEDVVTSQPNDFEVDEDVVVDEPNRPSEHKPAVTVDPEAEPDVPEEELAEEDMTVAPPRPAPTFNERIDEIIRDSIQKHHPELVPYKMQDQKIGFWRKIGPLNLTGEAGFIDNQMDGLVNIRRADDASLTRTKWGNAEMKLSLAIGPIEVRTNGYAKFMGIGPHVSYRIAVAHVTASALLHFNNKTTEVAVKSFDVKEILGLKFQITRAPGFVTPFVANQLIRGGISVFTPLIKKAVTRTGRIVLDSMVRDNEFVMEVMMEADREWASPSSSGHAL